ncbi:hypothetical protein [Ilumatobacter sp.]|uniref:hypothetical protein n=1 Tax=Ilumatobacter sp. TaxID=1967498 RepID=UPI003C40D623
MIDLKTYQLKGDKQNSEFFESYLPRVYERREQSGLDELVGEMAAVAIQVEHGDAIKYLAELAVMGPYRLIDTALTDTHRVFLLRSQPEFPRMIVLEPLSQNYEDETTRWNELYPLSKHKPNARYIGEVYSCTSVSAVRDALEPQNIRFVYPGDQENSLFCMDHLGFTFLSDFTYNRVGYTDVELDELGALGLTDGFSLAPDDRDVIDAAIERQVAHDVAGKVLGLDHMATRVLAGEREDAILEYLTMVPYYFWGAYNISEMNSSTNVTRHPNVDDDKKSPARVFTANNTPSFVNSFDQLPMPTEDFVRNFGRRMHHLAFAVLDGHVVDEKNVDYVVRQLSTLGTDFLAHVVGECKDEPNLKQIFSKSSAYSLLITEYVERCHGYEGFFTRNNVAALTEAAGAAERYDHGHVFD